MNEWDDDYRREINACCSTYAGEVIRRHLRDPKTALEDLRRAEEAVPDWLRDEATAARERCEEDAPSSRKRKRSMNPAPSFGGSRPRQSGDVSRPPLLWSVIHGIVCEPPG